MLTGGGHLLGDTFPCFAVLCSPKRYLKGACFLNTNTHLYVLNLLLPAIQNPNQEPTPWIKHRKQPLKQNDWSLWSDKYFLFCSRSHFLLVQTRIEDLRHSCSPRKDRPENQTKRRNLHQGMHPWNTLSLRFFLLWWPWRLQLGTSSVWARQVLHHRAMPHSTNGWIF